MGRSGRHARIGCRSFANRAGNQICHPVVEDDSPCLISFFYRVSTLLGAPEMLDLLCMYLSSYWRGKGKGGAGAIEPYNVLVSGFRTLDVSLGPGNQSRRALLCSQ